MKHRFYEYFQLYNIPQELRADCNELTIVNLGTSISIVDGLEIANGDQFMSVSKFVPDFTSLTNNVAVTLTLEDYPQSTTSQTTSGNVTSTTTKINVRGRGRSVKLAFASDTVGDTNWRLGSMKLQLRPDGRR